MSFRCGFALLAISFGLVAASASTCAGQNGVASPQFTFAQKIRVHGISDAGKLNDFLYRGSQPKKDALEQLKALGVDTIVDLRGERRGTLKKERQRAESLGMRFVQISGSGWSPPTNDQMVRFLSLLKEQPKRTIFVHCWLGSDRTGVFLAAYRIAFEGWEPEQAIKEMYAFHFKGFWHPAMKRYVRNFPRLLATSPELAPFRNAGLRESGSLSDGRDAGDPSGIGVFFSDSFGAYSGADVVPAAVAQ